MDIIQSYIIYNSKEKMNSAIILAAGTSSRFMGDNFKQFTKLYNDKTVLDISVNAFIKNKLIKEIIIVVPYNWKEKIQSKFQNCKVIVGGDNRSESSYNGLKNCTNNCKNVLIHDAARPLVSQHIINKCIEKLELYDATVPVLETIDSILQISNDKVNYLDRESAKLVQTPQGFNYNKILSAYKNKEISNDDFSLLINKQKNIKYYFFEGEKINFKITNKNDIIIARKLMK